VYKATCLACLKYNPTCLWLTHTMAKKHTLSLETFCFIFFFPSDFDKIFCWDLVLHKNIDNRNEGLNFVQHFSASWGCWGLSASLLINDKNKKTTHPVPVQTKRLTTTHKVRKVWDILNKPTTMRRDDKKEQSLIFTRNK